MRMALKSRRSMFPRDPTASTFDVSRVVRCVRSCRAQVWRACSLPNKALSALRSVSGLPSRVGPGLDPKTRLHSGLPSLMRANPPSALLFTAMSLSLVQVIPSLRYVMIPL